MVLQQRVFGLLLSLLKMEVENLAQQLHHKLNQKSQDSPTYRKAATVLESLMSAAVHIPNFNTQISSNPKTLAFYIAAGTFKMLKKTIEVDHKHDHQIDAYLLLLSMTLPEASSDALVKGGILRELRKLTLLVLKRKDITPLVTRLAVTILSHSFAPQMTTTNFHVGEDKAILLDLFDRSVASPRSNALSRQCSKLLSHLVKNNSTVSAAIAEEAKANLLANLQERKELYLSNVKEVIIQLPVRLVNDICYRVAANLAQIDTTDTNQEQYLAQTYFFLQKMSNKLLASTLEDMILVLVNAIPAGTMPQKVQLSYLQLVYQSTIALVHINEESCNRVLSPVISVMIEMLLVNQKMSKFAGSQLVHVINNCIRPSLWRKSQNELSLDGIELQQKGHDFTKIICLFQSMLSSRFPDKKLAANLIGLFFNQLEDVTFNECLSLIHRVVEYRTEFDEKKFRKVMESIVLSYGVESILKIYPLSLNGDIAMESFEEENNLWMLHIIEKTDRAEQMTVFNQYLLPLLQVTRLYATNTNVSKQRRDGYGMIEQMIWRCMRPFTKIIDTRINYEQVFSLIEGELSKVSQNTLIQLTLALEHLSEILIPQKYTSKGAEQLIKSLANILDVNSGSARQILRAIQGLAKISSPDYVKRVFDKNIQKLIDLGQANNLYQEMDKNLKNLQILMAVNSAIDLQDPSVTTKYRISRQELVLKLVTVLIGTNGLFQKKGYKYLNEILIMAPRSLYLEILELFEGTFKVQIGSKHYRLGVISKLWNWLTMGGLEENLESLITFIKNHLPQILLTLREQNKGARQEAMKMVGQFADTMESIGLLDSFIETVCAGFVGERSQMKLATLHGISVILSKGYCSEQMFKDVLELVLLLLQEKKQQLYKGVVEYCKRAILSLPVDHQKTYLPTVIQMLFESDQEGKMENRSILRHLLIKLTKKHGKDQIEAMIPQQHRKMLTHTLKMETRQKKKKKELKLARMRQWQEQNKLKEGEKSSDDESEGEREGAHDQADMDVEQPLEQLENTNNLLLKYDLDKEQFHFQQEQRGKPITEKKAVENTDEITFDSEGMMVIQERKRGRTQTGEEEQEQPAQKMPEQPLNFKRKNKVEVHQVKESGETYRTKRAGGDLQLKDKPEPYAFIQFNSKALNKRFKKRAEKVFDTLFEKKEGGLRGLKSRITGKH